MNHQTTATIAPKRCELGLRPRQISVNCRALDASLTGVRRYLDELLAALGDGLNRIRPSRPRCGARGHLWEQVVLPIRARGLLFSPANTGPIGRRDQVVTIHDVASLDHPEWFHPSFSAWYRMMTPRLVHQVRRVIAVSEFTKRRIIACTGVAPEKVVVVPNGVGRQFRPPGFEESERMKARYPVLRGNYLLYVGSLEPRKNLARLFKAWQLALRDDPDVTLVVAGASGKVFSGTGFETPPERVHMLGRIDDRDLHTLYGNALAFVYPSLYEGFGLPPLEAMACGTPVVVSDAASMPDLVGGAAIRVDPVDVESIAFGLRTVLGDRPLREDLRRRGLEKAREFSCAGPPTEPCRSCGKRTRKSNSRFRIRRRSLHHRDRDGPPSMKEPR